MVPIMYGYFYYYMNETCRPNYYIVRRAIEMYPSAAIDSCTVSRILEKTYLYCMRRADCCDVNSFTDESPCNEDIIV